MTREFPPYISMYTPTGHSDSDWRNSHHPVLEVEASDNDEVLINDGVTEIFHVHQFQHFISLLGVNPQTLKLR